MKIEYKIGDALGSNDDFMDLDGPIIIGHVCNTDRVMGAGIAASIRKTWPHVNDHYEQDPKCELGQVQLISVDEDVYVLNMIAQTLSETPKGQIPLSYDALEECLEQAAYLCRIMNATFVGPRFGSALAGGDWNVIEEMVERNFEGTKGVVIFDLPKKENAPVIKPRKLYSVK